MKGKEGSIFRHFRVFDILEKINFVFCIHKIRTAPNFPFVALDPIDRKECGYFKQKIIDIILITAICFHQTLIQVNQIPNLVKVSLPAENIIGKSLSFDGSKTTHITRRRFMGKELVNVIDNHHIQVDIKVGVLFIKESFLVQVCLPPPCFYKRIVLDRKLMDYHIPIQIGIVFCETVELEINSQVSFTGTIKFVDIIRVIFVSDL
jgi:hypothetical protein